MSCPSCPGLVLPMEDRPLENEEKDLVDRMLSALSRPLAPIDRIVPGSKFLGVSAGGRMGLAALLGAVPREGETGIAEALAGRPVSEAAALVRSPSPFLIALGLAAVNAANAPDPASPGSMDRPAEALIADLGRGKTVGLVGEFPFVETLGTRVGHLHLFELRPVSGALPRDQWQEVLASLDVLALTATTLLTRSMAWYLSRASRARIVILGPTTPFSRVLFDMGADYLCGSVVTDPDKVAQGLRQGLPFRNLKKKGGIRFCQWEPSDTL